MIEKVLCILPIIFSCFHSLAQMGYEEELTQFINEKKHEKVYLHFDKPHYAAGEDLWFKAYVTNAVSHLPTEVSSNLYVELINDEKEIIDSLTLFINEGTAQGSLSLDRDLRPKSYRIRAYTEWMRNFDDEFFYSRDFVITNPSFVEHPTFVEHPETPSFVEHPETPQKKVTDKSKLLVDFFPEGGDLIAGIPMKVAIKATDAYGVPIPMNGKIINDKGEEITRFESNHLGYALCFFEPAAEASYLAVIGEATFDLPPVKNTGASIRVIHGHELKHVHIGVLSKNLDLTDGTLVIHSKGQFLLSKTCSDPSSFAAVLKKSELKGGIIHLTFFDKNRIPLTERLIFPNPPIDEPAISITSDKEVYEKRSKVTLKVVPERTDIQSASVTINPQAESSYQNAENITNYLLLTSDLKGKIESPDYYFKDTKESYKALDLLMLTHGWSRFNWTSLLEKDDFSPQYLPENGLKITGRASNFYTDKSLKNALIGLTIPSLGLDETFDIDDDGIFEIVGLRLTDSTTIFIRALKESGAEPKKYKNAKVTLDYPNRPEVTSDLNTEQEANSAFLEKSKKLKEISDAYFQDEEAIQLDDVVVTAKSLKQEEMDRRTLYNEPSDRILVDSLGLISSAQSVFDLLRYVNGVIVTGQFPNQSVLINRGPNISSLSREASYYINGAFVDRQAVQMLNIQDVEFIDVLKGPRAAIFGINGAAGVIMVYTKMGGSGIREEEKPTGLLAFIHPGYHKAKEFYSPQYDVAREEHIIPDFRTTLYWNPEIKNSDELSFYTSDQPGNFVIRLEGLDTDGVPFFEESLINVR